MSFTWDELDAMQPKGEWRFPLPPTCEYCGYNLTGLTEERCPECGQGFRWRDVRQRAARTWALRLKLRHANRDARTGMMLAGIGWGAILVVRAVEWKPMYLLAAMLALVTAVMAVLLGAQVLNVRKLPVTMRAQLEEPRPRMLLGAIAMFLGLTLLLAVIVLPLS